MISEKIRQIAQNYKADLIEIRHHLHKNPELSFQEFKTAAFIQAKLKEIGINDIEILAETGTVALLKGKAQGNNEKCIALRADIDALPIKELNDVSYCSVNDGVMHACGHDVHTTCLLGAAKILKDLENEWSGTVKLIFQQGEEKDPGGASILIKEGVLENPRPDAIFGMHCDPDLPVGTVGFCPGFAMASTDEIYMEIHGKGGHGARPNQCIDPIVIASHVITSLQQIVSRRANPLNPTVLTFGKIFSDGGETNIIPDVVHIYGTLRTFDETWRNEARQLVRDITEGICKTMGGSCKIDTPEGYPCLYNNPELTYKVKQIAEDYMGGTEIIPARMGGEDFAYYSHVVPAAFYRVGVKIDGGTGLHTATFDANENGLDLYAGLFAQVAVEVLKGE